MRPIRLIDDLRQDLQYALRTLSKSPGFASAAILTLALGIGANTAIFSVLESQLWRPLPFTDSERLVDAHVVLRKNPRQWDVVSNRVFESWRSQSRSLARLGGYLYPGHRNLTANGVSERIMVMPVTAGFFDTFGTTPARGRAFLPMEETEGRDGVAMVSDSLWRNQLGGGPDVLGKPIRLDGRTYTVVGIASPKLRFEYVEEPDAFVPLVLESSVPPVWRNLYTIGRLAPGASVEQAREELAAILEREAKSEKVQGENTAAVKSLRETWTEFAARPLYFFAGAVALVLLIACVNASGLLLARGLARRREMAVRAALGAARGRLMRQSLTESLLLALVSGAAGALLGVWAADSMASFLATARQTPIKLDWRVLLFTLGVSVVSAVLAGVAPAVFSAQSDLEGTLRQGGRSVSTAPGQHRLRSLLVSAEVALGFVLLFGAGLFLSTFVRLGDAPKGFEAPGALTLRVDLRGNNYAREAQIASYFRRLSQQIQSVSGVRAVTLGSGLPLTGSTVLFANVNVTGRPPLGPNGLNVIAHSVAANYFQTLHIRLLEGRAFGANDTASSPRVAILNRNAAQRLFGAEDPLGKMLEFVPDERRGVPAQAPVEIVGVAENTQEFGADEVPFEVMYVPFSQRPAASAYVVVSADLPRGALAGAVRAAAYALDKDQPVFDLRTMDDRVAGSLRGARFNLFLVGALAAVAVALVSVGIFGMVAYFVRQRTQEFGVRLALGAGRAAILRLAIGQSFAIGFTGLAAGAGAALMLGSLLRHALYLAPHEHTGMLYGVAFYDPLSMGAACVLLMAVMLLASYVPARRAAGIDPISALRYE